MSRPAGDPVSELTTGDSVGIDFADEALADSVRRGMARVEQLLHESVQSDFEFATHTSLHLVEAGGKRFRPLFTLLAAEFGDPSADAVITSAAVVEMIHLATLYHDDVMDEATMRRGATSANARWDNSVAILTGDFLFARASQLIAGLGVEAVRRMSATFEALVTGQMRETVGAGAEEDAVEFYLQVIYEKTGSLIATAGRFGAWFAGADEAHVDSLERIGRILGTGFQISDDIIDIASPAAESGKTPGTDLREGVRTLPMLYALADPGTDPRLRDLLSRPLTEDAEVEEALALLRGSAGLARTRAALEEYADDARKELAALPDVPARDALSALVDYVVARTG
ncbi:geranylgeranyl pyrophosphate synthase [Saccharopolyspora subtropica]|uniref:Geranylgeranyl pyrophosphate synthase n=1 Tax=Saccharopolyspora thermophila TaxID=89367 RepID=A0A917NFS3_9PSEU|nr:polyprenyl synthetase family protein [Saccharopolyspora subtropica]GGI93559.1 geranylgeranyl pyrophosphate synthase [Saccharopolyspora subtropica]